MSESKRTLEEWIDTIRDEVQWVDIRPYSHNIICIALRSIAKSHGDAMANQVIHDCGLTRFGWKRSLV